MDLLGSWRGGGGGCPGSLGHCVSLLLSCVTRTSGCRCTCQRARGSQASVGAPQQGYGLCVGSAEGPCEPQVNGFAGPQETSFPGPASPRFQDVGLLSQSMCGGWERLGRGLLPQSLAYLGACRGVSKIIVRITYTAPGTK